jgi:hypothetical protein
MNGWSDAANWWLTLSEWDKLMTRSAELEVEKLRVDARLAEIHAIHERIRRDR